MTSTLSPTLGGTKHADTQLYVTATHKVRSTSGKPPFAWVPYGVQHAWPAGSRKTLCGEWTSGWTVFWERSFSATPHDACPACVEASLPEASRRRLDPALRRTA
ncbi:hypothetical protein GCM10022223_38510 [Kineosporia mesophila]|uniref:Zinc-ribbon domain-containing protein n=1 Tax=Kineosporia mesophila TaxID=566012 RepID=A0ABP6ZRN8_9ACTN|nr:hypothetical protein [Kineosporia mesophila]MCD5348478.1 hypothetical protein [Kineosporia mesophila]